MFKTVQDEVKEQKWGFLSMLLGTLGVSLLGNLLTGKGIYRAWKCKGINRASKGTVRTVMRKKWIFDNTSSFN